MDGGSRMSMPLLRGRMLWPRCFVQVCCERSRDPNVLDRIAGFGRCLVMGDWVLLS